MAKSQGSKPDKFIRDALILELNRIDIEDGQKVKKLQRIVHKLVNNAIEGKIDAISLIFDRVEGKAVQGVALTDQDGSPLQVTWRAMGDALLGAMHNGALDVDAKRPAMLDITPTHDQDVDNT